MSCGAILLMTFLYNTVFGKLTTRLTFPFYTLSSISDTALLHRINGIDVIVWVMAGLIRLALFAFAFRAVVRDCFGGGRAADISAFVFCAASLIMSEIFTANPALYEPMKRICSSGIPLTAVAVILRDNLFPFLNTSDLGLMLHSSVQLPKSSLMPLRIISSSGYVANACIDCNLDYPNMIFGNFFP